MQVINEQEVLGKDFKIYGDFENPLFLAKDVAEWIEHSNVSMMLKTIDEDEKVIRIVHTLGGNQEVSMITEDGLYEILMLSRKPIAKEFKKKVKDILKQLRQTMNVLQSVTYTPSNSSLVNMRDGFCYTTTNKIAELFNERHFDVLRIVESYLLCDEIPNEMNEISRSSTADFMKKHIKETVFLDSRNRPQRSYELDEYAFSMVALSFTGKEAEQFKIVFIEQFFNMRQALLDRTKALAIEQVLPQKNNLRQYVYLIKNEGTKNIKIGVGQNPEQRLKQLQTGADADLTLIYKSMVCSNAFEIETYMHKQFQKYNVRNEWFNCGEDILIEELERCEYVLESDFKTI